MSSPRKPPSGEQARALSQLAGHEENGVSGGFAHRRMPQASTTLASLGPGAPAQTRTLIGGGHDRIAAGDHQELGQLWPAGKRRAAR